MRHSLEIGGASQSKTAELIQIDANFNPKVTDAVLTFSAKMEDVEVQEPQDSDVENYNFDTFDDEPQRLNIENQIKPPVYPQQKVLANNIVRRLDVVRRLNFPEGSLKDFKKVDFQVSLFCDLSSLFP